MNNFDKIINLNRIEGNRYNNKECIEFYRNLLKYGEGYWEVIYNFIYLY